MEGSDSSNGCCDFLSYWSQRIHLVESEQEALGLIIPSAVFVV